MNITRFVVAPDHSAGALHGAAGYPDLSFATVSPDLAHTYPWSKGSCALNFGCGFSGRSVV